MGTDNNKLTREEISVVLRKFGAGATPTEIARELGLDYGRVYHAISKRLQLAEKMEKKRQRNAAAFQQVLRRMFDILTVLGNPGALDYSKVTGGVGAQYARRDPFALIDFTVDVNKTSRHMIEGDRLMFKATLATQEADPDTKTEAYLGFEQRVGSLFISRGLYPVADYFGGGTK